MSALPYNGDAVFAWMSGTEEVSARPVGAIEIGGRSRVVLLDAFDRHWVAEVGANGQTFEICSGPVTGAQALHAAELVVAGIRDHGSATALVNTLAIGLVARICTEQEAAPCAR